MRGGTAGAFLALTLAPAAFGEGSGVYQGSGYSFALPDGWVAQLLKGDGDADEHVLVYPKGGGSPSIENAEPSDYGRLKLLRLDVDPFGASDAPSLGELRKETAADLKETGSTAQIQTIRELPMQGLYVRVSAPKPYDYFVLLGDRAVYELTCGSGSGPALAVLRSLKETTDPFAGKKLVKVANASDSMGKSTRRGRRSRERPAEPPPDLKSPGASYYSDSGYSFALPQHGPYKVRRLAGAIEGSERLLVYPSGGKAEKLAKAEPGSYGKLKLLSLERKPFDGGRPPTLDEAKDEVLEELDDEEPQVEKIDVLPLPGYYIRASSPRPFERFLLLGKRAVYVWTAGSGSRAALEVVRSFRETAQRDPFGGKKLAAEKKRAVP